MPAAVSIVVTSHEQCNELRLHLPAILEQEFEGDFEVIVVDINSTDDTMAMLETMQNRYPNLHVIRTPHSARNISPVRLALTLAFRSASHDLLLLTQADCCPASPHWLSHMAQAASADEKIQMVLGHTRFIGGKGWHGLRCRFFRAWQQRLYLSHARHHRAYRADGTNLLYRRSLFLSHRGFADHANLLAGAVEIMVNQNSTKANTSVCLHPDAVVLQDTPRYRRWWGEERLFFMETRRHFRQGLLYRLRYLCNACQAWVFTLLCLAAITIGVILQNYIAIGTAAILWLAYLGYHTYTFNKDTAPLGEPPIKFAFPLLLHLIPLWDLTAWLRWIFTKPQIFQKKYI